MPGWGTRWRLVVKTDADILLTNGIVHIETILRKDSLISRIDLVLLVHGHLILY